MTTTTRFWAVDKIVLAYFAATAVLIAVYWSVVPSAALRLTWHLLAIALLILEVKLPNPSSWIFRNWYPILYVASCYKEMSILIGAIRHSNADQALADLDYRIWGVHPTVWLERILSPPLTEFLQIAYTLFIPMLILAGVLLWWHGKYEEFRYYAFLISLGFLASYVGYILVPARGPRFLLKDLQHMPLQGMWFFRQMQSALDQLESTAWDCFPSGHTELTILAWWSSRMISNRVFWAYLAYTPFLIFATVYLRYHYTVDVMAGILLAAILIAAGPAIYRRMS